DGWHDTALLTITHEDSANGKMQFSSATYSDSETNATHNKTITVTRASGSYGAVSVHYVTSDGSATAGSDYTATSGDLNWADGDASAKTFDISITGDVAVEPDETVNLTLSAPTGGATLGSPDTSVLTITNDDTTLVVNSTADTDDGFCTTDAGGCTLREAINAANFNADTNTITFDGTVFAPAGPYTINLTSALPG